MEITIQNQNSISRDICDVECEHIYKLDEQDQIKEEVMC
jgi:hypothetical protein